MVQLAFTMFSPFLLLALALPSARALPTSSLLSIDVLGQSKPGAAKVQFTSDKWGLDAPKVLDANSTVFDWWYFDAVAPDASANAVIIAFNADVSGLWTGSPVTGSTTWYCGLFSFPNGTVTGAFIPAEKLTVVTVEDGSSAAFTGVKGGWASTPDMKQSVVTVDEPDAGMQGTMTFNSVRNAFVDPH